MMELSPNGWKVSTLLLLGFSGGSFLLKSPEVAPFTKKEAAIISHEHSVQFENMDKTLRELTTKQKEQGEDIRGIKEKLDFFIETYREEKRAE